MGCELNKTHAGPLPVGCHMTGMSGMQAGLYNNLWALDEQPSTWVLLST